MCQALAEALVNIMELQDYTSVIGLKSSIVECSHYSVFSRILNCYPLVASNIFPCQCDSQKCLWTSPNVPREGGETKSLLD